MKTILKKASLIKLIATDIDGVWTDSMMYYNCSGVIMKSFSTYDGMGASLLLKNNFIIAMITSEYENIEILNARAKKLNIKEVYTNEKNKLSRIEYLMKKYNLKKENIAYIGDDINDLEALKFVGLSASPPNTPILNYFKPDFITSRKSGKGAFRDLSDLILKSQNIEIIF
jgi:YrbI family 3-deoxy-D-manno-octulosonate 8-phosphate phosphatase